MRHELRGAGRALLVGSVAVVIASSFAARLLSDADWDVTVFAAFGEDDVDCVMSGSEPKITATQGRQVLELALKVGADITRAT